MNIQGTKKRDNKKTVKYQTENGEPRSSSGQAGKGKP